ncbi:MAG: hypothetical protein IJF17_01455 [Thermoguttaceae bacterium]|nr:hypothetical protein [Thermoguttaceae bacterium]
MSEFNPYSHWLNFTGKEKPDTYYELLGLKHGEKNVSKIAERIEALTQMVQQKGPDGHFPEWNQILTEIQVAKNCLCNPKYKAEYDAKHPAPAPQAQPGMMGMPQQGMAQPGMMGMPQQGMAQPGMMGMPQQGMAQPGMMGMPQQGMVQPGMMGGMSQQGMAQPGMMGGMSQQGMAQPGMMGGMPQQGMVQPGMMGMPQQGMAQPGMMGMPQQGMVQPGMMGGMPQQGMMGMGQQPGMGIPQGTAVPSAAPQETPAVNSQLFAGTSASQGPISQSSAKVSKSKSRKPSGPSPMVRNVIALVGLLIVAILALAVVRKYSGNGGADNSPIQVVIDEEGKTSVQINNPFASEENAVLPANGAQNQQNAPVARNEVAEGNLAAVEAPDFATIFSHLQNYAFEDAKKLIAGGMKMTLQDEDSQRLERLKVITKNMEEFHTAVANQLNKYVPPMELCGGQYGLVESGKGKAVIRINGKNVKFSMDAPQNRGHDLYDIIYRHQFAEAFEVGNMLPALQYAAFLLVSPTGDREKAEKLLSRILEKGSDDDRETANQIMREFGINGLGLMTNMALESVNSAENTDAQTAEAVKKEGNDQTAQVDEGTKEKAAANEKTGVAESAGSGKEAESGKNAEKTSSKKSRKKARSAKGTEAEVDADEKKAEDDAKKKAEEEEKARQEEERRKARRKEEWKQLTTAVRQDISWRKIPSAKKTLDKLENLAETPENKEELDRLNALADYMESFVTWISGRMGSFTWGSVHKVEGIEFSVVECGPGVLIIRDQGINKRYTVNDLNPKLVAWLIDTPKEADDFVLYGTYLAMTPGGDRAKAKTYWTTAQTKGFDKESIALIMKELEVPLPDAGKAPVQLNAWNPRGKAPVEEQTIPTGADFDETLAMLKKEFAKDYAKSEMRDQMKLSEKFVKMAQMPARSAAEAYVMTEEAIRMAKNHAFYEIVFQAYLVQETRFQRDTYQDRLEMVQNAKPDARGASSTRELANCALEMGFDAVKRQKKIEANQMLNIARANAKGPLIQRVRELERNISMMK